MLSVFVVRNFLHLIKNRGDDELCFNQAVIDFSFSRSNVHRVISSGSCFLLYYRFSPREFPGEYVPYMRAWVNVQERNRLWGVFEPLAFHDRNELAEVWFSLHQSDSYSLVLLHVCPAKHPTFRRFGGGVSGKDAQLEKEIRRHFQEFEEKWEKFTKISQNSWGWMGPL